VGGHAGPGVLAAALSLLNCVSAYAILPESLPPEHRRVRELWPFGHMARSFLDPHLRPLLLVWGVAPFAFAGYTVALPLWAAARLGWREWDLTIFFGVVGITAAIVQGGVFRLLTRVLRDRTLLIIGMFGMAAAIAVVPLLASSRSVYAWTVLLAISNSLMSPAAAGLVSSYAGAAEQGTVLGAAQSVSALGRLSGPEVIGGIYDLATPTAAFVAAAVAMLLGGIASLQVPKEAPPAG
jgi:DHA1 family tetracycline resistance protein-like MFS transporter